MNTEAVGQQVAGFEVTRGDPSDEELAAIVAVVTAVTRQPERARPAVDSREAAGWKSYWAAVRAPFHAGRGAWRHSYR